MTSPIQKFMSQIRDKMISCGWKRPINHLAQSFAATGFLDSQVKVLEGEVLAQKMLQFLNSI